MEAVKGVATQQTEGRTQAYLREFTQAANGVKSALNFPESSTFVLNSEKDRIRPPSSELAKKVIQPNHQEKSLATSPNLAGIQSGVLVINGAPISINPEADSFIEIVSRITGSDAGVTARFDSGANRLVITSDNNQKIEITKDTSGFLEEVNVTLGSYQGSTKLPDFSNPGNAISASDILDQIADFSGKLKHANLQKHLPAELVSEAGTVIHNLIRSQLTSDLDTVGFTVAPSGEVRFDRSAAFSGITKMPESFEAVFVGKTGLQEQVPAGFLALEQKDVKTGNKINITA